jgi:hypothetical protein
MLGWVRRVGGGVSSKYNLPTNWDRRMHLSPWWWPILIAAVVGSMIFLVLLLVGSSIAIASIAGALAALSSWSYITTMRLLRERQFRQLHPDEAEQNSGPEGSSGP